MYFLINQFYSTHPGTGVPIVLAGSKLTSDQVCKSFGKSPLPRKIQNEATYTAEVAPVSSQIMTYSVYLFIITFLFFALFPTQSTNHTAASFVNSYLPKQFRVTFDNDLLLERY